MAIEKPPYQVLEHDGHFEIRQYADYIVAEVPLAGDYESTLSAGFRILADYIFGHNQQSAHIAMTAPVTAHGANSSEKVAMTAPVTAQRRGETDYVVAFMMPTKYSMDTLPRPIDHRITFRVVRGHRAAAVAFSGSFNEKAAHEREGELLAWIQGRKLTPYAAPLYANYSPPWIPPLLRRNEVIIDLGPLNTEIDSA